MVKRIMKKRKEKTRRLTYTEAQLVNAKYMGKTEPELITLELGPVEYSKFLNWYNYMSSREEALTWLSDYLVKRGRGTDAELLKKIPEWAIPKTAGYVARILDRGYSVPTDGVAFIDRNLNDALRHLPEEAVKNEQSASPEYEDRETALLNALESRVWSEGEFDIKTWSSENRVSSKHAEVIRDFMKPRLDSLKSREWKDARAKAKRSIFQAIVDHMEHLMAIKKTVTRAPRKPRTVTVEKKLRFVRYQRDSAECGVTSIDPAKILGAKEVWFYNTKYRTLSVLRGESLDINRTTVIGYDPARSESRGAGRKFTEVVRNVVSYPPRRLEKLIGELKGTPKTPQDRMNENTLILRVT